MEKSELNERDSVLRPTTESLMEVFGVFDEIAETMLCLSRTEKEPDCFPYDNVPEFIPDDLLEELEQNVKIVQRRPDLLPQLVPPRVSE